MSAAAVGLGGKREHPPAGLKQRVQQLARAADQAHHVDVVQRPAQAGRG